MMRAKNRPITSQVVKVVHDDSNKQIDDLQKRYEAIIVTILEIRSDMINKIITLEKRTRG